MGPVEVGVATSSASEAPASPSVCCWYMLPEPWREEVLQHGKQSHLMTTRQGINWIYGPTHIVENKIRKYLAQEIAYVEYVM